MIEAWFVLTIAIGVALTVQAMECENEECERFKTYFTAFALIIAILATFILIRSK